MTEGTRLSEHWNPLPEVKSEAASELRVSSQDYEDELIEFRAYWKRATGTRAKKVNWDRTWWNWLRKVQPSKDFATTYKPERKTGVSDADRWRLRQLSDLAKNTGNFAPLKELKQELGLT